MRKRIVGLLLAAVAAPWMGAQEKPQPPSEQKPPEQAQPAAAEAAPPQQAVKEPAAAPAPPPAVESNFSGNIEFGYRFVPNIDGSFNTYRSVVNLGEGPKLFGADAA